jgi:lipoprotein-anchoring transpeptidase ErfK/SrfK
MKFTVALLLPFVFSQQECARWKGSCIDTAQCNLGSNSIISGICPGPANNRCCMPDSQPAANPKDTKGRAITSPRVAVVDLNTNMLFYYENQKLVRKWNVGTGRDGHPTPVGNFKIYAKDPCPVYGVPNPPIACFEKDPSNPLGRRAMWFLDDYGLHGTSAPELISERTTPAERRLSKGCVRNLNDNIVWLYDRMKVGDPVIVFGLK